MKLLLVIYGSLEQISGGYLYDRLVVRYLREHGVEVDLLELPARPWLFSILQNFFHTGLRRCLLAPGGGANYDWIVVDELVHPSVFLLAARRARRVRSHDASRARLISLVHHLKSREEVPWLVKITARWMERKLVNASDAVIVNSRTTARTVQELLARPVPIAVCPPGSDLQEAAGKSAQAAGREPAAGGAAGFVGSASSVGRKPRADPAERGSGAGDPVRLLITGNIIPRKGHDLLIRLLAGLRDLSWELRAVGKPADRRFKRKVDRLIRRFSLRGRVRFTGSLTGEALAEEYRRAHVFVFTTRYEGFGISLAEAVRAGLPFVAFASGAISEVVQGRGLLVPQGDEEAFQGHLRRLIADTEFRKRMSDLSRELIACLSTWEDTGRGFLQALRRASGHD